MHRLWTEEYISINFSFIYKIKIVFVFTTELHVHPYNLKSRHTYYFLDVRPHIVYCIVRPPLDAYSVHRPLYSILSSRVFWLTATGRTLDDFIAYCQPLPRSLRLVCDIRSVVRSTRLFPIRPRLRIVEVFPRAYGGDRVGQVIGIEAW